MVSLLQMFVGLPWTATRRDAKAALDLVQQSLKSQRRRAQQDHAARGATLDDLKVQLDQARQTADLADKAPSLEAAVSVVEQAGAHLSELTARHTVLVQQMEQTRRAEEELHETLVLDRVRVRDLRETAAAQRFFGALKPTCCPRCSTTLDQLPHAGLDEAHCRICGSAPAQAITDPSVADELAASIETLSDAHGTARSAARQAAKNVQASETALAQARQHLAEAQAAMPTTSALRAHLEVARLEGAFAERQTAERQARPPQGMSPEESVLDGASKEADKRAKDASAALLGNVSQEICSLAIRLGMKELQSIKLFGNGKLEVVKGDSKTTFSAVTPGEQVRLRIATLLALLRVGKEIGVGRHPGLLLLDSAGAQETIDVDLAEVLSQIQGICGETPGLQVIMATAKRDLATAVIPLTDSKSQPRATPCGEPSFKVTNRPPARERPPAVTPLEALLARDGDPPTLADLGGEDALWSQADTLAASRMWFRAAETLLDEWDTLHSPDRAATFITQALSITGSPTAAGDTLDRLVEHPGYLQRAATQLNALALERSRRHTAPLDAELAGHFLEAALRLALPGTARRFALFDRLVDPEAAAAPTTYARRTVRALGTAYEHWRDGDLRTALQRFVGTAVHGDAVYELAMCHLADAANAPGRSALLDAFATTRGHLQQAIDADEDRPDATAFLAALDAVLAFEAGDTITLNTAVRQLRRSLTEQAMWLTGTRTHWRAGRYDTEAAWYALSQDLEHADAYLDQPLTTWPNQTIQHILATYTAHRSVRVQSADGSGGMQALVAPRIENAFASRQGILLHLRGMIADAPEDWDAVSAQQLLQAVDERLQSHDPQAQPGAPGKATQAASYPELAAAVGSHILAALPTQMLDSLKDRVSETDAVLTSQLPIAQQQIFNEVVAVLEDCDDFRHPVVRQGFIQLITQAIRFLYSRTNRGRAHHTPRFAYLFAPGPGPARSFLWRTPSRKTFRTTWTETSTKSTSRQPIEAAAAPTSKFASQVSRPSSNASGPPGRPRARDCGATSAKRSPTRRVGSRWACSLSLTSSRRRTGSPTSATTCGLSGFLHQPRTSETDGPSLCESQGTEPLRTTWGHQPLSDS